MLWHDSDMAQERALTSELRAKTEAMQGVIAQLSADIPAAAEAHTSMQRTKEEVMGLLEKELKELESVISFVPPQPIAAEEEADGAANELIALKQRLEDVSSFLRERSDDHKVLIR